MILNVFDTINEFSEKLKEWTIANTNNPLFWLLAFVIGLVIVKLTYDALSKK